MRWLITGASGFLGANAARVLAAQPGVGHVAGIARDPARAPWCDDVFAADLLDASSLQRAVRAAGPDVVLHCAALADHHACEEDEALAMRMNADASEVLAAAAAAAGARFVYVSTDAVFSGERGGYAEDDEVSPNSAYGRSKAAGEAAVLGVDPTAVITRTNFFGWSPSGHRSILEFFVRELSAGNRVPGFVNYTVTSLFSEDVIASIAAIVDSGEAGIFHVAARDALAKVDFGRLVAQEFGFDPSLIDPVRMDGPDKDLSLRSDRLAALRGSPMPSQAEGVARARCSPRF